MDVSQILHMYITSLINMAFKYNEHEKHETNTCLKIINEKACKHKYGVRDSYQNR